jgi:hypothetical protein
MHSVCLCVRVCVCVCVCVCACACACVCACVCCVWQRPGVAQRGPWGASRACSAARREGRHRGRPGSGGGAAHRCLGARRAARRAAGLCRSAHTGLPEGRGVRGERRAVELKHGGRRDWQSSSSSGGSSRGAGTERHTPPTPELCCTAGARLRIAWRAGTVPPAGRRRRGGGSRAGAAAAVGLVQPHLHQRQLHRLLDLLLLDVHAANVLRRGGGGCASAQLTQREQQPRLG